jgi:hypothetical protein
LIHLQQLDRHPVMGGSGAHGLIETDQTVFQALAQGNMQGIFGPSGGSISKTEPSRNVKVRNVKVCRHRSLHNQSPLA